MDALLSTQRAGAAALLVNALDERIGFYVLLKCIVRTHIPYKFNSMHYAIIAPRQLPRLQTG